MSGNVVWGLAVVILAGILQGSFAAPMKRMSAWRWENSWLLFALSGLIIFPWIINFATVPNVLEVYSGVSTSTLIKVVSFGALVQRSLASAFPGWDWPLVSRSS